MSAGGEKVSRRDRLRKSMKEIKEVEMVDELMEFVDEMTDNEADFIEDLCQFLDPNDAWENQRSEKQKQWLYAIHDKYCNENPEAFEDWEE